MRNKLLLELKEYVYDLKSDTTSDWRKFPVGMIFRANTIEQNRDKLKSIINIILSSKNVSLETKIYVSNKTTTIKDTNLIINELIESKGEQTEELKQTKKLSYNNTMNKISIDNDKLTECIGENTLSDLVYSKEILNIRLDKVVQEFGISDSYRENLHLEINQNRCRCNSYKGSEEFFEILNKAKYYVDIHKRKVEDTLNSNKKFTEYFNYLLNSKGITDKDIEKDRLRLIKFLKGEE